MPLEKEVLTPQEVAEYLQLTPETIYRYIRQGKLAASKIGRYYRVPRENVELFLMATSIAGDATLRQFSRNRILGWLEEDQIDEETRAIGEKLVTALAQT
ncbi:MAG: helix-turn-helix domain-containing protein [Anaerolineae bacterium]